MAQAVAAGLGPDSHAVRAAADFDLGDQPMSGLPPPRMVLWIRDPLRRLRVEGGNITEFTPSRTPRVQRVLRHVA